MALTSCTCKTLKRMINLRLTWFLESNNLLSDLQTGFRAERITIIHQKRTSGCSPLWPRKVLQYNLAIWHTQRRLPTFMKHFLEDQTFQTRINNTLSDPKPQEIGVPQGSILSMILFMIKINKITICLFEEINRSLYVGDFLICYSSKNMVPRERKIQQCINKILKWTMKNGIKIISNKTKCMHFYQIHKMHNEPTLILNGSDIPITQQYKFLGITLGPKLFFIPHIKQLKIKCNQTIQLLINIAYTDWGADKKKKKPNQTMQMSNVIKIWLWLLHIRSSQKILSQRTQNYPSPETLYCPRSLFNWKHRNQWTPTFFENI